MAGPYHRADCGRCCRLAACRAMAPMRTSCSARFCEADRDAPLNAHPRLFVYISGCPAPAGILADLVASAVNPIVVAGACRRSRPRSRSRRLRGWPSCWTSRVAVACWSVADRPPGLLTGRVPAAAPEARSTGYADWPQPLVGYGSTETHTWIKKAADLWGWASEPFA